MKLALRILALLAIVIAAACTGGEKSGPKELTSGTYAWRNVQANDGCQFLDDFGLVQDVEVLLLVTTTSVTIDSLATARDPNDETRFAAAFSQTLDWSDDPVPYDCIEDDDYAVDGVITGENVAQVDVTITFTAVSGTGCNLANAPVTLPCTSEGSARLERL